MYRGRRSVPSCMTFIKTCYKNFHHQWRQRRNVSTFWISQICNLMFSSSWDKLYMFLLANIFKFHAILRQYQCQIHNNKWLSLLHKGEQCKQKFAQYPGNNQWLYENQRMEPPHIWYVLDLLPPWCMWLGHIYDGVVRGKYPSNCWHHKKYIK